MKVDGAAVNVLPGVVKVDVEVLYAALVRVAVAQVDAGRVVLKDGRGRLLRKIQEVQDVTMILRCLDAVRESEVFRLGGGGSHQALLR